MTGSRRRSLLFAATHPSELASLGSQRHGGNDDESKGGAQVSRRNAVDAGTDDCRCFVHGATFPEEILSFR